MNEIYIKTEDLPRSIANQCFGYKDIITLEELITEFEDKLYELNGLEDEYNNFKQEVEDNYKFVGQAEQIGYNENW